jgi:hypothetical protein
MSIILIVVFNMQHKSDKARAFKDVHSSGAGVDLMIVDIPEGLSISMMSFPPTFVLDWNSTDKTKKFKACPLCNC